MRTGFPRRCQTMKYRRLLIAPLATRRTTGAWGRKVMCKRDPDRLMDVTEAAALLGLKPGTLYSWASKGKVPFRKVGAALRFHRGELLEWTKGQGQKEGQGSARDSKLRVVK